MENTGMWTEEANGHIISLLQNASTNIDSATEKRTIVMGDEVVFRVNYSEKVPFTVQLRLDNFESHDFIYSKVSKTPKTSTLHIYSISPNEKGEFRVLSFDLNEDKSVQHYSRKSSHMYNPQRYNTDIEDMSFIAQLCATHGDIFRFEVNTAPFVYKPLWNSLASEEQKWICFEANAEFGLTKSKNVNNFAKQEQSQTNEEKIVFDFLEKASKSNGTIGNFAIFGNEFNKVWHAMDFIRASTLLDRLSDSTTLLVYRLLKVNVYNWYAIYAMTFATPMEKFAADCIIKAFDMLLDNNVLVTTDTRFFSLEPEHFKLIPNLSKYIVKCLIASLPPSRESQFLGSGKFERMEDSKEYSPFLSMIQDLGKLFAKDLDLLQVFGSFLDDNDKERIGYPILRLELLTILEFIGPFAERPEIQVKIMEFLTLYMKQKQAAHKRLFECNH